MSVSPSFSPSFSPSLSASISPSISPSAPEGFNYTRESRDTLPTVVTDLATAFTPTEYTQVATDDTDRVDLTVNNIFGIYLFKIQNSNNTDNIDVTWNGQSSQAPTSSPVKLQIWDWEGSIWEDMDEENGVGANTDFNLTGTRSSEPHHYSGTFVVACRVYQENKL